MTEEIKVTLSDRIPESNNIYFAYADKYIKYDLTPLKDVSLSYVLDQGELLEVALSQADIGKQLQLPDRALLVKIIARDTEFKNEEKLEIKVTIS
jgi:hypothetical protein